MLTKCAVTLLALAPLGLLPAQFVAPAQPVSTVNTNDFVLVAQDNTPAGMFGTPGAGTIFTLKTVAFTLSHPSAVFLRSDLHQFHAAGGHPYVGTRVLVDGVEHMSATGTWVSGSSVPRKAGEYYTTPPGVYPAGTHTATLQIEETGENQIFEVYARPTGP